MTRPTTPQTLSPFSLLQTLRRQKSAVLIIMGIGVLAAIVATLTIHTKYTATATILMVAEPPESQNPQVPSSATKPLLSTDLPSLVTSSTVLTRFLNDIHEQISFEKLRSRIRAKVLFNSTIMPVQYTAKSEHNAIDGANTLADEVTTFYRQIATQRFDSLIADLNHQMGERRKQLTQLDSRLNLDVQSYPYVDVRGLQATEGFSDSIYQRLVALKTEHDESQSSVNADIAAAHAGKAFVDNATPLAIHNLLQNDPVYQALQTQYARDLGNLRHLEAFANEKYPGLSEQRHIVAKELAQLVFEEHRITRTPLAQNSDYVTALDEQAKADGQLAGDQAKLSTIEKQMEEINKQLGQQGNVVLEVARLRRDRDNVQTAYTTLADRLAKTAADRAEAASTGSVVVIDHASFAQRALWTSGIVIGPGILVFSIWLSITAATMLEREEDNAGIAGNIETGHEHAAHRITS